MLLKLLFCVSLINSFLINYDTTGNTNIYLIDGLNYTKLEFNILKQIKISLVNNNSFFGYLNNVCIKSYECCQSNNSLLYKNFNKNNCSDILISSCMGSINQTNMCYDSHYCEKYNSTYNIKYMISFKNENDIKCFYKYKTETIIYKIDTNIDYYETDLTNLIDDILTFDILGDTYTIKNITHRFLHCNKNTNPTSFYYDTVLFQDFNSIIKTNEVDCKKDLINYNINYLDNNHLFFNSLKKIDAIITDNLIQYPIYTNISINITNKNIILKEKNKGCLINLIENNKRNFYFSTECMNDEFKYINFSIIYDNPYKIYSRREIIIDNDFSFFLDTYKNPSYFINHINGKDIKIDYINSTKKFLIEQIIIGDENYVESADYKSTLTIVILVYSIIALILILISVFIVMLNKKIIVPSKQCGFRFNEPSYEKLVQMIQDNNPSIKLISLTKEKQIEILLSFYTNLLQKDGLNEQEININKGYEKGFVPDEKRKKKYRTKYKNPIENRKNTDKDIPLDDGEYNEDFVKQQNKKYNKNSIIIPNKDEMSSVSLDDDKKEENN